MGYIELIEVTEKIIEYNDETIAKEREREKLEFDFYHDIKPFVSKVDEGLEEWKQLALDWLNREKPKYIHVQQIEHVCTNLQSNSLQCFAQKINKKRFYETHQAIHYTLQNILEQCR
ncbi:YppE family protein [Bacillus sp. CGMCC 1.60114]|uniref:YppE family protein n=1 Tax=unclassified Bacillus (in: firmicutes) TaxID=185979 RepID=UPI003635E34E